MIISGEQIREAALSHEQTCPAAMKDSFYYGFREGAKWMQHELDHLIEGEMESGELLAYNCEKRARQETLDKVCDWLRNELFDNVTNIFFTSVESKHCNNVEELLTNLRNSILNNNQL